MSKETIEHLNQFTLIGFTSKRGHAWHYRADAQSDEPNHYENAVPIEDVERRLFNWDAESVPVMYEHDGQSIATDRQAIKRSDTGDLLGIFKASYKVHQFRDKLLRNLEGIIDGEVSIGSAGLLRNGAQAWVSIELPDNVTTSNGVIFRPNLLACSSHDGSLATSYQRVITNVVCDNTMAIARSEESAKYKIRHTKYSDLKLLEARNVLDILFTAGDEFSRQVDELCQTTITDSQFERFLDSLVPVPSDEGKGRTMALNTRDAIDGLYRSGDERVAQWHGTAFGVYQTVNTYSQHMQGTDDRRIVRNLNNMVTGKVQDTDANVLKLLAAV